MTRLNTDHSDHQMLALKLRIISGMLEDVSQRSSFNVNILIPDKDGRRLKVHGGWKLEATTNLDEELFIKIGEGVSGRAAWLKEPVYESDVTQLSFPYYIRVNKATRSEFALPILPDDQRLLGVIDVESPQEDAFGEHEQLLLKSYAAQIASRLASSSPAEQPALLNEIEETLTHALFLEKYLHRIYDQIRALDPEHQVNLLVADEDRRELLLYPSGYFYDIEKKAKTRIRFGEGVTGRAAESDESVYEPDVSPLTSPDRYVEISSRTRSNYARRLRVGQRVVAVLNIENPKPDAISPQDRAIIDTLVDLATQAFRTADALYEQASEHNFAVALRQLTKYVAQPHSLQKTYSTILEKAAELSGADVGLIRLFHPATKELVLSYIWPETEHHNPKADRRPRLKLGEGLSGKIAQDPKHETIAVKDVQRYPDYIHTFLGMKQAVGLALYYDEFIGVFVVESKGTNLVTEVNVDRLQTLANVAIVATVQAQEFKRLERERRAKEIFATIESIIPLVHEVNNLIGLIPIHTKAIRDRTQATRQDVKNHSLQVMRATKSKRIQIMLRAIANSLDSWHTTIIEKLDYIQQNAESILEETAAFGANLIPPETQPEPLVLGKLVQATIEDWQERGRFPSGVELELKLTRELPMVRAHATLVKQILHRLFENAIDAMSGKGTLKIEVGYSSINPLMSSVTITDTGHGIQPEIRPHIFEASFTTKNGPMNKGLGLWWAKTIAQHFGGDVDLVWSEVGKGSQFALSLPTDHARKA